ncbi:SMI1/KNR4 family protein [Streptomyces lancefieldiae]|uniref:SMI1/KNR4 family protein n=1 Tax=Streptomyces lancefieldiae TaxID=3075520 RepID=A0ABU3B2Y1_9ACTN|nr:SMI1/KNR4 family protein [Streptomyces sp. DSM 40712]MDT0616430.1 SMI1/KNR4 family protein [Streptomyces sp. DSM 40712]
MTEDLLVTDDDIILAVRAHVADQELPDPATADDVRAVEQMVGHPMPRLLRRLYLEVANGGFGSWEAVSLTDTGDWFSDCADITEAYHDFADPEHPLPPGIVPLMDRGCAMWALIDFKTADGQMWDWDPNLCCTAHALAPLEQSLTEWITDWLHGTTPDGTYPQRETTSKNCTAR